MLSSYILTHSWWALLFGIWLDMGVVGTGGTLAFPKDRVAAAPPPAGGVTAMVFNGSQEHCTLNSTTRGHYSVSIMLTRKTWNVALCSVWWQRELAPTFVAWAGGGVEVMFRPGRKWCAGIVLCVHSKGRFDVLLVADGVTVKAVDPAIHHVR